MILPKEKKDKIIKDIKAWPKILVDALVISFLFYI